MAPDPGLAILQTMIGTHITMMQTLLVQLALVSRLLAGPLPPSGSPTAPSASSATPSAAAPAGAAPRQPTSASVDSKRDFAMPTAISIYDALFADQCNSIEPSLTNVQVQAPEIPCSENDQCMPPLLNVSVQAPVSLCSAQVWCDSVEQPLLNVSAQAPESLFSVNPKTLDVPIQQNSPAEHDELLMCSDLAAPIGFLSPAEMRYATPTCKTARYSQYAGVITYSKNVKVNDSDSVDMEAEEDFGRVGLQRTPSELEKEMMSSLGLHPDEIQDDGMEGMEVPLTHDGHFVLKPTAALALSGDLGTLGKSRDGL